MDMESGDSLGHIGGDVVLVGKFLVSSANLTTFVSKKNLLLTGGTMQTDDVIDYYVYQDKFISLIQYFSVKMDSERIDLNREGASKKN